MNSDNLVNSLMRCCKCPFFKHEDVDGVGICDILGRDALCSNFCYVGKIEPITEEMALKVLHYHQKWRRGGRGSMASGYLVGISLDVAIRTLREKLKSKNEKR